MSTQHLLERLPQNIRDHLMRVATKMDLLDGQRILFQGQGNDSLFIVERGSLVITRNNPDGSAGAVIAVVGPAEAVGDMSVLLGAPASANVDASGPTTLIVLSGSTLQANPDLLAHLRAALGVIGLQRLERATRDIQQRHEREMRALEVQISATRFIVSNFVALSFYMLSLPIAQHYVTLLPVSSIVSLFVIVVFFLIAVNFLRGEGGRLKEYGFTLKNWPRQVLLGLTWGAPIIVLVTLAKVLYLHFGELDVPLFVVEHSLNGTGLALPIVGAVIVAYIIFSFCQEVVRSGIQKALELYYVAGGVDSPIRAALAASLVFAATHSHLGISFSLVSAAASLYWSALYRKTGSYLAVAVNHGIVGAYIVFILGPPA